MGSAKRSVSGRRTHPPVIEEPLATELDLHRGKWVAIHEKRIVAVGGSALDVVQKAQAKGITDPYVFRVPVHPEHIGLL
jgi:uncharacterized protein DUF5678